MINWLNFRHTTEKSVVCEGLFSIALSIILAEKMDDAGFSDNCAFSLVLFSSEYHGEQETESRSQEILSIKRVVILVEVANNRDAQLRDEKLTSFMEFLLRSDLTALKA